MTDLTCAASPVSRTETEKSIHSVIALTPVETWARGTLVYVDLTVNPNKTKTET